MILVTGHLGFLGSKLTKHIKGLGIDLKNRDDLLTCDLPDNIDLIYHLAAQTSVEESWNDPITDFENIGMTLRLIVKYPNARIIYAASAASLDITSPYGLSKKVCEEYLRLMHKDYVICRFPNVFGGGKGVADIFKGRKDVQIYGDGKQIRDFVHADDIIKGLLLAQKWPKGDYSMGSGKGIKVKDLAVGKEVTWMPARKEIRESILANTTPDWKPVINVKKWIKDQS